MILTLTLICSLAFFHFFGKALKKKPAVLLYGICILLSLVSIFYPREGGLPFLDFFFKKIMQRGVLAGSLFIWVMLAPVLPKSFSGRKIIYLLRGEMAICASLITLAHNLAFGGKYFGALFFGQGHISLMELHAAIVSCLMILLLIPLTITSFQTVRRKMQGKSWKKLQNWSYLFYLLLYLHIFFIYQGALIRGKGEYFFTLMLYSFIFGFYGFLRIRQYRIQKEGKEKKTFPLLRIGGILPIVCLFLSGFYSAGKYRAALEANVDKIRAQESVAEQHGQGEAIAKNLAFMSSLHVPVIAVVTGEGSSGGALGICVANKILMLENAIYSVLSPEGFATILWKDSTRAGEAAKVMKLTAEDLKEAGVCDEIIPEVPGGAQENPVALYKEVEKALEKILSAYESMSPEQIREDRLKKYRNI